MPYGLAVTDCCHREFFLRGDPCKNRTAVSLSFLAVTTSNMPCHCERSEAISVIKEDCHALWARSDRLVSLRSSNLPWKTLTTTQLQVTKRHKKRPHKAAFFWK